MFLRLGNKAIKISNINQIIHFIIIQSIVRYSHVLTFENWNQLIFYKQVNIVNPLLESFWGCPIARSISLLNRSNKFWSMVIYFIDCFLKYRIASHLCIDFIPSWKYFHQRLHCHIAEIIRCTRNDKIITAHQNICICRGYIGAHIYQNVIKIFIFCRFE